MTDEELARLASKAVGYTIASTAGAALKLATDLRLCIHHNTPTSTELSVTVRPASHPLPFAVEGIKEERYRLEATCRAIVRCAAEIGKEME